jgi:hypothetical protein
MKGGKIILLHTFLHIPSIVQNGGGHPASFPLLFLFIVLMLVWWAALFLALRTAALRAEQPKITKPRFFRTLLPLGVAMAVNVSLVNSSAGVVVL